MFRLKQKSLLIGLVVASLLATGASFPVYAEGEENEEVRDAWEWPFAKGSIWNMPVGSEAVYVPANLQPAFWVDADLERLFQVPVGSPKRTVYEPGSWTNRCSGQIVPQGQIEIPDDLYVADATTDPYVTPNNASALVMPDGRTVESIGVMARCEEGGPVYGYRFPVTDLYGQGLFGSHGASMMSAIGGSIREGELVDDEPIRHALKVNMDMRRYGYYGPDDDSPGYRWPAHRADHYAKDHYLGDNPALEMGTLFAIPPHVTKESLGLQTKAGMKLFDALQDYGAYLVDDTYGDNFSFTVHDKAVEEFEQVYGHKFGVPRDTSDPDELVWHDDVNKLFTSLHIIANNAPDNVGGGGTPRQPLAPDFEMEEPIDQEAPTSPSNAYTSSRSTSSIKVGFDPGTDNRGIVGYIAYTSARKGLWNFSFGNTPEIDFYNLNLSPDTEYAFYIHAIDGAGNLSEEPLVYRERTLPDDEAPSAPGDVSAVIRKGNSVELHWSPSHDNLGVQSYEVLLNENLIGSASNTKFVIEGLEPETDYSISVIARDLYDNRSAPGTLAVRTLRANQKEYAETFDRDQSDGWSLNNAWIGDQRLNVNSWGGWASAFFSKERFSGSYVYTFDFSAVGDSAGNKFALFFNRQGDWQGYTIRGGGGVQPLSLMKELPDPGREELLAVSQPYNLQAGATLEIRYDNGEITVTGIRDGERTVLFDRIADTTYAYGDIGFGSEYNFVQIDNIHVIAELQDTSPPSPPQALEATDLSPYKVGLAWEAAEDDREVTDYIVYQGDRKVGITKQRSLEISNLEPLTSYSFAVKAMDGAGNLSELSTPIQVVTPDSIIVDRSVWTIEASHNTDAIVNTVDGSYGTKWQSGTGMANGMYVEVDMGSMQRISGIVLDTGGPTRGHGNDFPPSYEAYVSVDGQQWTKVDEGIGETVTYISFEQTGARYYKVVCTGQSGYWWTLFELFAYDSSPPDSASPETQAEVTSSGSLVNGWYNGDVIVTFAAVDDGSGIQATYYRVDGMDWTEGNEVEFGLDGEYDVEYYSVDEAGNEENMRNVNVRVDQTGPDVQLTGDLTYKASQEVQVFISAADEFSGMDELRVTLDGQPMENPLRIRAPRIGFGTHLIEVQAFDRAGNETIATYEMFIVPNGKAEDKNKPNR